MISFDLTSLSWVVLNRAHFWPDLRLQELASAAVRELSPRAQLLWSSRKRSNDWILTVDITGLMPLQQDAFQQCREQLRHTLEAALREKMAR